MAQDARVYIKKSVWSAIEEYKQITRSNASPSEILEAIVADGLAARKSKPSALSSNLETDLKCLSEKFDVFSRSMIQAFGIIKQAYQDDAGATAGAEAMRDALDKRFREIESKIK